MIEATKVIENKLTIVVGNEQCQVLVREICKCEFDARYENQQLEWATTPVQRQVANGSTKEPKNNEEEMNEVEELRVEGNDHNIEVGDEKHPNIN